MPSIVRAIVNSLIPEDKKSKVEFVADADIAPWKQKRRIRPVAVRRPPSSALQAKSMRQLCEANQLEEQYGGTAPNVPWLLLALVIQHRVAELR